MNSTITTPTGPYFFYGSLQHPPILSHILRLSFPAVLRPAKITGHAIRQWGPYPALVATLEEPTAEVHGLVFDVKTEQQARDLAWYETSRYEAVRVKLRYLDVEGEGEGEEANGWVFRWCGGNEDLREGEWSLQSFLDARGL